MDKKLKKYIERYEQIDNNLSYELMPNGGMIVVINQETNCELLIKNETYKLKSFQAMLINAYETSVFIQSNENLNLTVVRFKGAGASFFYEKEMHELMQVPTQPIYIENNILENELDSYFKNRLTTGTLPFNIMKIIDLLDKQGSNYNVDEVLAIANIPRKTLDKIFSLRTGLSVKTYSLLRELGN
jgi:hypothetical protein